MWPFRRVPETREMRRKFLIEKLPRNAVCAEIGVFLGDFTELILKVAKPSRIFLIDPWFDDDQRYESVVRRFETQIRDGTVVVYRETSSAAAAHFAPSQLDWIYIDGDHHYEFVKADLEDYFPRLKPGGFITGDDYHYPGDWDDGVTRAVDEFLARGLCKPIFLRRNSIKRHSQYMLQKPPG
jgi:predicted O-methyltransferase YrrM